MVVNNRYLNSINRISETKAQNTTKTPLNQQGDFASILEKKVSEVERVKFSKHADMRLKARNINLSDEQKNKIDLAVKKADEKGVRESLVMMDNFALVVNIKNRTVITAVSSSELKDNVFTNIDGAVIT